ncbi:type VI secretion system baseplate subunit TssE [Methylomarinum sp. Ch1-1]|uniref:Type VI secretion system baseplate subunit TssE n=1 Tax=Methylomarinum roseum TaxID=3067653 RepID=A0AAU7NTD0_9GAMM|nr:type VI secretion system baseplate subunit TssE [Methylomarinum sp. Ch1-1]MDP4520090.1 type VI secretion system baseplate subunit TssE [Methylomarinum sp. Ch1-1]
MAELTPKERLQPSLLDRLTDDEPGKKQESRDKRVLSMHKLRQSVLRDISWLMNASSLDTVENLDQYPEVARSVVNYGIKDLSGRLLSGSNLAEIERNVKQAIQQYEPRILPHTLNIHMTSSDDKMSQMAIVFDIEASLWAQPLPLHLYLRTEINKVTGDVDLRDLDG